MDSVLQGLKGVQCNQDDMIITGMTHDDHMNNLHAVLERLQHYGLKVNMAKCTFLQDEVIFCGIKLSKEGLHKTEDKIKAIRDAPVPTNKSELRSFMGLVNYYHKWLRDISQIATPLHDLLQDNTAFKWTRSCQSAFQTIKTMVASDEILIKYNPDLPLRLATDASPYGLGAVLSHITNDGEERPIAYASRTLNKAEKNYSQLDKEAIALVWAVKKFYYYLYGRHFTVITDHQPLKFIFDPTKGVPAMIAARQQRCALFLSGFKYTIEYRSAKANANADSLSRLPLPASRTLDYQEDGDELFYTELMENIPVNSLTVAKESRRDPIISRVITFVLNNSWSHTTPQELQPYFARRHEIYIQNNCLFWGYGVILPKKVRQQVLQTLHSGHIGIVKMKGMALGFFWWPGMDKDIEAIAKNCQGCSLTQQDPITSPLHPWQWPDKPWRRVHLDYAGPFLGSMFLVLVDAHSKWVEIIPTQRSTTRTPINILSSNFARFGIPDQIVSDNGPQFASDEFKIFIKCNGIRHIYSAPYHPATNGLAERMVSTFKTAIRASKDDPGDLQMKLSCFLIAYRNAPHSTTNESPATLMFGRKLRTQLDILVPDVSKSILAKQTIQQTSHSQANRDYRGHQRWQYGIIHASTGSRHYEVEVSPCVTWRRHTDQILHTYSSPPCKESIPAFTDHPQYTDITNVPPINESSVTTSNAEPPAAPNAEPPAGCSVRSTCSPAIVESPNSSMTLPCNEGREHPDNRITNIIRSGRVVRLPTKYTD